jgi:hypothetical protein
MSKERDLEIAEASRNEMLWQAIDRAVLGAKMKVEAAKDAYDLYHDKCVVDPETCQITLENLPLDQGLAKIIEGRPLWRPSGPDPRVVAQQELEAAAKSGNVSAHGRLWRSLGTTDAERTRNYNEWCAKNAAKPGTPAAGADDTPPEKDEPDNPWLAGKWNATRQSQIVRSLGLEAAQRIAKAAGSYVGATKPAKAA